jgi:hypothetical protein
MVGLQAMSEFKFACPVCGQHITADSAASGGQLECPTCFRKIVIPDAPSDPDTKFILSAAQVDHRRASGLEAIRRKHGQRHRPLFSLRVLALMMILILASAAAWVFRDSLLKPFQNNSSGPQLTNSPPSTHERWTLDLTNAPLPDSKVTGRILGIKFNCEKVTLEGGVLSFYQNAGLPSERRVTIPLFARRPERLMEKAFEISHDRTGPRPKLLLEVRHAGEAPTSRTVEGNYALKMEFEEITNALLPGSIYLAIADDEKSYISGQFDAQIIRLAKEVSKQPTNAAPNP